MVKPVYSPFARSEEIYLSNCVLSLECMKKCLTSMHLLTMLRLEADLLAVSTLFYDSAALFSSKFCSCIFFPHKLCAPKEHKGNYRYKQVPCELSSNAVMGLD